MSASDIQDTKQNKGNFKTTNKKIKSSTKKRY